MFRKGWEGEPGSKGQGGEIRLGLLGARAHVGEWSAGRNSRSEEEELGGPGGRELGGRGKELIQGQSEAGGQAGQWNQHRVWTCCGSDGQVTREANGDQKWMLLLMRIIITELPFTECFRCV